MYLSIFDDDIFNIDLVDEYDDIISPKFGNILYYNCKKNFYDTCVVGKSIDKLKASIIGIVLSLNKDLSINILLKNYLTANPEPVPFIKYYGKAKFIPNYLKDLFERYSSKYKRTSLIDLSLFEFSIPNIAVLDYLDNHICLYKDILTKIWGEEKTTELLDRLYTYGLFSEYKGKYYLWLPIENGKRVINNLMPGGCYEFLPIITMNMYEKNEG